jgi:ribosomal protein L32
VCWNADANLCEGCAPNFTEQLASYQAQAKADAARQQLAQKAQTIDYASGVDMAPGAQIATHTAATNTQAAKCLCGNCGAEVGSSKFCPECGKPTAKALPTACPQCGTKISAGKFCGNCGTKLV